METVQMGLVYLILLAAPFVLVLPTGVTMGRLDWGASIMESIRKRVGVPARVVVEPSGGGGPVILPDCGTVFFDKEVSFPERRVLYPALFVYGPTSLAR